MCGIAGVYDRHGRRGPPSRETLSRMASSLLHRGPDEVGFYREARVGLAHARLSIVDLATGQQPLANEDESLWVVFNGEIFNYVELRQELEALGHRFRTRSDTEVLVHAYEEWGDESFARMNGQWAVALFDERNGRLVLCRDRVGVRPLYVCEHDGIVYFGSEVKAIFAADPSISRELDPRGLDETFTFWTVVAPTTVFRSVTELRPGHVRTYERGEVREHAFDEPTYPDESLGEGFSGSIDEAAEAVRAALDRATELRMLRADVPVGSYLSGGLDSSFVAALGRRHARGAFHTFSIRFADAEYDETEYQRSMAARLESEHHEIVVTRNDIAVVFPRAVEHAERPVLRTAPAPLFLLSSLVQDTGIKVVLTGEGADEMFAGYDLFREGKVRRFWSKQPSSEHRPRILEKLYPYLARSPVSQAAMARQFFGRNLHRAAELGFAHETRWQGTAALKRFFSKAMREATKDNDVVAELLASVPDAISKATPLAQDQYLEIRTLLSGYLMSAQGDRMLMANSIEGRFPFLDKDVMALANSLPHHYKLRVLDEKHVVKRAARGFVDDAILRRPKQPYRAPDALSFLGPNAPDYVRELFSAEATKDAGVFEPALVERLYAKCSAHDAAAPLSNADNMAFVGVLSTHLVHRQHVRAASFTHRTFVPRTVIDRIESER